jgi:hypothetical protein
MLRIPSQFIIHADKKANKLTEATQRLRSVVICNTMSQWVSSGSLGHTELCAGPTQGSRHASQLVEIHIHAPYMPSRDRLSRDRRLSWRQRKLRCRNALSHSISLRQRSARVGVRRSSSGGSAPCRPRSARGIVTVAWTTRSVARRFADRSAWSLSTQVSHCMLIFHLHAVKEFGWKQNGGWFQSTRGGGGVQFLSNVTMIKYVKYTVIWPGKSDKNHKKTSNSNQINLLGPMSHTIISAQLHNLQ